YRRRELLNMASGYALNRSVKELIEHKNQEILRDSSRLMRTMHHTLEKKRLTIDRDQAKLGSMNPYAVLNRGYTILQTNEGHVIPRAATITDEHITEATIVFADGKKSIKLTQ